MYSTRSYKWYLENGCEIVPLKRPSNKKKNFSLALLDMQADFSDLFNEIYKYKNETTEDTLRLTGTDTSAGTGIGIGTSTSAGGMFYRNRTDTTYKDTSAVIREKYVMEVDQLWAYIEWHYNFEDEIKIQKNMISDFRKIKKIPKLHVSTHVIEGTVHNMVENENICILKYTTFSNFAEKYKEEMENLKKKNHIFNICNYVYEVCDIANQSLVFANSPVINTTVKNILSITKSGKKREDFNEEEEKESIIEDEIWQVYVSKKIQSINDQWLLICVNDTLKEIIKNSEDIYFKMFNKYIKEYNEFIQSHDYHINKTERADEFNSDFLNEKKSSTSAFHSQFNQDSKDLRGYEKYKINLIFSENKDINYVIYKLCVNLGKMNSVVLCTKHKSYNVLMNDIDGTLAICFKSFLSKYFKNTSFERLSNTEVSDASEIEDTGHLKHNIAEEEDNLIKTISIMGLCKEKMLLFEKATIFSNIDLLYSYYVLVHTDALNVSISEKNVNKNSVNNMHTFDDDVRDIESDNGIIYINRKALFENIQFSNEEISSYLLHLQKYSNSNLLYIKNKGFRYVKNEIVYEFLMKLLEIISLHDDLYEEINVEKFTSENPLFKKYQEDLYKVQKKRYGITFKNIFRLINENMSEFQLFQINRLPVEKYVILQLCLKCCDVENRHFEYFTLYYNYYFFYEYLNKDSNNLCFEDIFEKYLLFLHNEHYVEETVIYINLFKMHKLTSLNILRTTGIVNIHSNKLFTFDMKLETYVKYIDDMFKSFNSTLMDKIIQYFIKNYQFFLDYGYDRKAKKKEKEKLDEKNNIDTDNFKDISNKHNGTIINNAEDAKADRAEDMDVDMDKYRNRVFFRNNIILNVSNINHICNDEYMFHYFIVVKYYYHDNSFGLLETKLKKFIKKTEEDFITSHQKEVEFDIDKKLKTNWQTLRSNYCLNYKIFKYQTIPFPNIRLHNNYNDLLNTVYSPLSIHFSIFHENTIYNKKKNSFQLIPSFLLKDYLRSCLTTLYMLKNSYYAQELYPFLNPLLNNKDMIGTIAVPPLRHCRTKLIENENENNVEFIEMANIVTSTLNSDIKRYKSTNAKPKKYVEKLCKLYNCNLPINNFN